jgi:hypothetical protein
MAILREEEANGIDLRLRGGEGILFGIGIGPPVFEFQVVWPM